MKSFIVFTKKEIIEQFKNYKLQILGGVLLIFSMLSPVFAKLMPEILKSFDLGIEIAIPDPTFVDSYAQFFKNINQTVIIILIFMFSGNIVREITRGTAILMFSKGLSRTLFIISKFVAELLIWTGLYILSVGVFLLYTQYLFPDHAPVNLVLSMLCLWLFGVFILAVICLGSVLANQSYIAMLISGGIVIILLILGAIPKVSEYLPTYLSSVNIELILGAKGFEEVVPSLIVTIISSVLCICLGVAIFQKKQI